MKKIILFPMLFLFCISVSAQLELEKKIVRKNAVGTGVDQLGNYYLNTPTEIFKYNPFDTLFSRYSELQNGNITSMDVTNPMKITVFYATFSRVIFLDNTLNSTFTPTDLYSLGLETATLVCSSFDNGIWIYDAPSFSLTRINSYGDVDRTVKNINQLTGIEIRPTVLKEKENLVYLMDPSYGIFVFDIFGGFLKKVPITGIQNFSVVQKNFFYTREDKLYKFDSRLLEETSTALPKHDVKQALVEKDRLFILTTGGELYIYKLPK